MGRLQRGALAVYGWLFTPTEDPGTDRDRRFWAVLWAAIAVAAVLGLTGLQAAFADNPSIQDDARQHIFWMRRFMEPDAFAGDAIADYFQTVSPWGVKQLYRAAAALGINPLFFNKLLPFALGLVTAIYSVILGWMMMPVPAAVGLGAILLQISLWMRDDLVSGTAVAFAVPLMVPVLVHGFRNQRLPLAIALLALTGTYPQCALVMVATLTLGTVPDWWLMRRSPRQTRITVAIAWLIFILGALPFLLRANPYGPVMTAAEAQTLGTFAPKAWSSFFYERSLELLGVRSTQRHPPPGMVPPDIQPFCSAHPPVVNSGVSATYPYCPTPPLSPRCPTPTRQPFTQSTLPRLPRMFRPSPPTAIPSSPPQPLHRTQFAHCGGPQRGDSDRPNPRPLLSNPH